MEGLSNTLLDGVTAGSGAPVEWARTGDPIAGADGNGVVFSNLDTVEVECLVVPRWEVKPEEPELGERSRDDCGLFVEILC